MKKVTGFIYLFKLNRVIMTVISIILIIYYCMLLFPVATEIICICFQAHHIIVMYNSIKRKPVFINLYLC